MKLFEVAEIDDFSLPNAKSNAKKLQDLSCKLLNDNNPEWVRAFELYIIFELASNYYDRLNLKEDGK